MRIGKYRINLAKFAEFVSTCFCALAAIAAFVFFFGFCYGGFMR